MQWLNEPAQWHAEDGTPRTPRTPRTLSTLRTLSVTADGGTDFWRITGYGYVRDNGHLYGDVLAGDFDLSMRVRGTYAAQYDQAGAMVRVDERHWIKTGIEFFEGRPRFSTVVTLEHSSWAVADLPSGAGEVSLSLTRRGDAVEVRYAVGGGQHELAALAYLPPGREVIAGAMCAAPEGGGFPVTFHDLVIDPR